MPYRSQDGGSEIQTLVFSKTESPPEINGGDGWTVSAAQDWAREHDFESSTVDEPETGENIRLRQFEPERCREGSYVTVTENLPRGIKAVSCERKGREGRGRVMQYFGPWAMSPQRRPRHPQPRRRHRRVRLHRRRRPQQRLRPRLCPRWWSPPSRRPRLAS